MNPWSKKRIADAVAAANGLRLDEPPTALDSFLTRALQLSIPQQVQLLGTNGKRQVTANLTKHRQVILEKQGQIPSFVIFQDPVNSFYIAGMLGYLRHVNALYPNSVSPTVIDRLRSYVDIIAHLRTMKTGHDLEAVSSAILDGLLDRGFATQGSGDQGVDAIGIHDLLKVDSSFIDATAAAQNFRSTKVFAVVSSKQHRFGGKSTGKTINPAFIRELMGGWMLQRSEFSAWKGHSMQLLSPIQMILATTYELSTASKLLCEKIGIQVWGVPQLVFLIACAAPPSVFSNQQGTRFSIQGFSAWWKTYDGKRLKT